MKKANKEIYKTFWKKVILTKEVNMGKIQRCIFLESNQIFDQKDISSTLEQTTTKSSYKSSIEDKDQENIQFLCNQVQLLKIFLI